MKMQVIKDSVRRESGNYLLTFGRIDIACLFPPNLSISDLVFRFTRSGIITSSTHFITEGNSITFVFPSKRKLNKFLKLVQDYMNE